MLVELRVRDLGVIAELNLVISPGMTALTGETGAGKTLVVEALELLVGGRADASMVRTGAAEAVVEGRFVLGEKEVVLSRAVPTTGRSRAYVDGHMAPVSSLSEIGDELVDLHGQHAHQSLLRQVAQREALDTFAGVDLGPLTRARRELSDIDARLDEVGGDPRELARTVDLLRFQAEEIARAVIVSPDEEELLASEESVLAQVGLLRESLAEAHAALVGGEGPLRGELGASDLVGLALARLAAHDALGHLAAPLRAIQAELEDVVGELRRTDERLEEDPERLEAIRQRLQLFSELRRKYGPGLLDVLEFARGNAVRLAELEATEETRRALGERRLVVLAGLNEEEQRLGDIRRQAAPKLAAAVEANLQELALSGARLEVRVGDDLAGSQVEFFLGANPGEPALPLAKVASGGELARAMLATRLVLSAAPPTLVFDEVDAGVGGEAALAVGRALSAIGSDHQVLVVTHLAQVAAFADQQVLVSKSEVDGRTLAQARPVTGEDRVIELSRMLSGHPDSSAARRHAKELLELGTRSVTASRRSGSLG